MTIQVFEGDGVDRVKDRNLVIVHPAEVYHVERFQTGNFIGIEIHATWPNAESMDADLTMLDQRASGRSYDSSDILVRTRSNLYKCQRSFFYGHRSSSRNGCVLSIAYHDHDCYKTAKTNR